MRFTIVRQMGVGLSFLISALVFASFPQNKTLDSETTKSSSKSLRIFAGVNSAAFLKDDATDLFEFPVDLEDQGNASIEEGFGDEFSKDNDVMDAQTEGEENV